MKGYLPLTIKILKEAAVLQDDSIEFDGISVAICVIVGRVISVTQESNGFVLEVNDSTGNLRVLFPMQSQYSLPIPLKNFIFIKGAYVKIYGATRTFGLERVILGRFIKPLRSLDDVSYHFLSAFVAHAL